MVMLNEAGAFSRLLELVQSKRNGDAGMHRMLLELLYEMSRIQQIKKEDLSMAEAFTEIEDTLTSAHRISR